ncbi:MAG: hypothetical protein AAGF27_10780 [Pseudomonadota bacterium]
MSDTKDNDEVLARVTASIGRRALGIGMLIALAFMVIYVAIVSPPSLGWQIFLIAIGTGALMVANTMRVSTQRTLELTRSTLRDDTGTVLADVGDIRSIDRGAFAFKPSNGFVLRLHRAYGRDWRPGLWWRLPRRVGVGGMTPMRETKYMAEVIALLIAEREGN